MLSGRTRFPVVHAIGPDLFLKRQTSGLVTNYITAVQSDNDYEFRTRYRANLLTRKSDCLVNWQPDNENLVFLNFVSEHQSEKKEQKIESILNIL